MKKVFMYAQSVLGAVALFMAVHSFGPLCMGRYYQPEEPAELKNYVK